MGKVSSKIKENAKGNPISFLPGAQNTVLLVLPQKGLQTAGSNHG